MKYLQYILYGVIVGRWILCIKGRIFQVKAQGRYAVVAMNTNKGEYVLVGRSGDKHSASVAADFVEDNSMFYIGICYDLMDHDDRDEFDAKLFCPYIEDEDRSVIEDARSML